MITRPPRIQALLQAYHTHNMEVDSLYLKLNAWSVAPSIGKPSAADIAAIAHNRDQLLLRYPMSFRSIVADSLRCSSNSNSNSNSNTATLTDLARFFLSNNFDESSASLGVYAENPILAVTYITNSSDTFAERISLVLNEPLLTERLKNSPLRVQSAFIQRCIHYLPDTAEGAAILTAAIHTVSTDATEPTHLANVYDVARRASYIANAVFKHPHMRRHLYAGSYADTYYVKAVDLLKWNENAQHALRVWKAVDARCFEERAERRAAAWRTLFWGHIVLTWRAREFKERYYAPGGRGAAAAAARFYESIRKEQQAIDERRGQGSPTHLPSIHEQDSREYERSEYYMQDSPKPIYAS